MRKNIFILLVFFTNSIYSQSLNWEWAINAGSTNWDVSRGIITDVAGNSYITGEFSGVTVTFGDTVLTNGSSNNGATDFFIAKYDSNGNFKWARRAGGADNDGGSSIAIDINEDILVTGFFNSPTITFGNTTLSNSNSGFAVKYDSLGNVIWAKGVQCGTVDITTDPLEKIIVTGGLNGDVVTKKYSAAGNLIWTNNESGNYIESASDVSTDISGNIYVRGGFWSDTLIVGNTTLVNESGSDAFLIKYDTAGNVRWAKNLSIGTDNDGSTSILCNDINGDILLTGYFYDTVHFDNFVLSSAGGSDLFVAKYDTSGTCLWAYRYGGSGDEKGESIFTDAQSNVFIGGFFISSTLVFGNFTLNNVGVLDAFITKFDSNGSVLWATSFGGISSDEVVYGLSLNATNNVLATGYFRSVNVDFDNNHLINTSSSGSSDIYISKLGEITGIEPQQDAFDSLLIYPNPATTEITVNGYSPAYLKLCNAVGQTVAESTSNKLYVGNLSQGLYVLQLFDEKGKPVKTEKVIVAIRK